MSKIEKWKNIYSSSNVVGSELLRSEEARNDLTVEEMREFLQWSGDDEFVEVDENKNIIVKTSHQERPIENFNISPELQRRTPSKER